MPLSSKKKLDDVSSLFKTSLTYIFLKKNFKMLERPVKALREMKYCGHIKERKKAWTTRANGVSGK